VKRALFAALALSLTLVALELALRALGLPDRDGCFDSGGGVWIADDGLGFALEPGLELPHASVNARSLRGPELSLAKPPGVQRIVFLGDSSAFGQGVALDETFGPHATAALERELDAPLEYLLGASPGYSAYQSRVLLERLLPYAPDLVVLYVGARNDHTSGRFFRDDEIPARMARRRAAWHDVRLLRALELTGDLAYRRLFRRVLSDETQARVPPDDFERHVRAMLEATRAANARALLLLPPFSSTLLARRPLLPRYQEILTRLGDEYGVPTVRLQDAFAPHPERELYSPRDDFHPNARGHRLIAERVIDAVRAHALLGGRE
jgi:lysophospholipase L1-like esterase